MQLEQVLLNIFANARDALGKKSSGPKEIRLSIRQTAAGDQVKFEIGDNAGGIDAALLERIFEPFFTTKEIGKGTGLGLSISYGIVQDMGGTIEAANGPDGAIFTIRLPVSKSAARIA